MEKTTFEWSVLVEKVQDYIRGLNYGYKSELKSNNVQYLNALGTFEDPHNVALNFGPGKEDQNKTISAERILIAVGGRPTVLTCPGGELALTSDDIFSSEKEPGKVCVVGASYVALEIAGFLTSIGCDVTVLVRSILLRGFDQEMAELIKSYMTNHGTKFVVGVTPQSIVKDEATGKLTVTYGASDGEPTVETFDTVLQGIGRFADTKSLGLDKAGVEVDKKGKIPVVKEQTNVPNIYAIGDVITGIWELTPVAIQAGKMLAQRLYGGSTLFMDYHTIPTTVFTPLEYGAIGYAEEDALTTFGEANIEVYHTKFTPLEWSLEPPFEEQEAWEADKAACYCKLVCLKTDGDRVVGFHYCGPNAGEVTQGFATAMRLGATKLDFDMTIGIHPTCAENFTTLKVTKSSGESAEAGGC